MDVHRGAVLYAYNEHMKMHAASLAKMMTFYLRINALRQKRMTLETEMPVSEAAWRLSIDPIRMKL
jgi:D-alanyl-D-alanine carboxypeptidase (penicillin-binding protein 5/6)